MAKNQIQDNQKPAIIGPMVKKARLARDMSQLELARALGYNYGNFIGMIENSTAKFPRDAVLKFAYELEIPPEQFIKAWMKENQPDWLDYVDFHSKKK